MHQIHRDKELIIIERLAYSFHLGNDKNKTKKAKQMSENSKIETSSFNNNAIQNSKHLGKVNNHNLRKYDNNQEQIKVIKGTNDIVEDVKELYKKEFEESRLEYNNKQTRNDRKINDYFTQISNDNKHDLACEIIIELGNMRFWKNKTDKEKYKMIDVYQEQVKDLERLVPSFKIANATIHFDESSPHMHVVGIAIKDNCKTGMKKQVGKTSIFTKDSLKVIQEEMRKACIKSYNKTYGLNSKLKDKKKGRNKDYTVSQMVHYDELVIEYDNHQKLIEQANNKTKRLHNKSNEVKEILTNLKQQPLNKNNSVISNENKQVLLDYIEEVNKSNQNVRDITNFTISLDKVKEDLEDNQERIEELETIKYEQKLKIDSLTTSNNSKDTTIRNQKTKIADLKKDIDKLKEDIEKWKGKIMKLIKFIKDKLFGNKEEREQYIDVAYELNKIEVIENYEFDDLCDTYEYLEKYEENRDKSDGLER